MEIVDLF